MFDDLGEVGLGVMVRNAQREVIASLSKKIQQPVSMTIVKLLAARQAAQFVHEIGLHQSSFEGDFEMVISFLNHRVNS